MISYSSPGYLYNEQQLLLGSKNICCAVLCRALIKTFINKCISATYYFCACTLNFVRQPAFGTRWTRKQILINIQRYEKDRQTNEQSCSVVIAKIKGKHIRKTYTGNLFCLFAIACCFWSLSIMLVYSHGDITIVGEGAGPPNSDLCFVLRAPQQWNFPMRATHTMTRDIHFFTIISGDTFAERLAMALLLNGHDHRSQSTLS